MLKKKHVLLILLLLMVSICAISSVSATDDATDLITAEDGDDVIILDESNSDGVVANVDEDLEKTLSESNNEEISVSQEDNKVSKKLDDDVVSYYLPSGNDYKVKFTYSDYSLSGSNNAKAIKYSVTPCTKYNYLSYDLILRIYDGYTEDSQYYYWGNEVYNSGRMYDISSETSYQHTIPANSLKAGIYWITLSNYGDNVLMAGPVKLTVTDNVVITVNNYNSYYNSGATMNMHLANSKGVGIRGDIKVVFSNSKTSVTRYYTTDTNGNVNIVPPVGAGTYSVTISSNNANLKADSIAKTAIINKAPVNIKAYKVTEYKGFKTTIKAKVTSNGKNVNQGTVTFKINGKTYKVAVKNGWATKTIKLSKTKTYKYTAKFNGNTNLQASKKVKAKAVLKKRLKTKIVMKKHYTIYSTSSKIITINVKTAGGKNVKDGKIKIRANGATSYAAVKNGKVKVLLYGLGMKHFKSMRGNTETYKKVINKVVKLKYIPTSHKYKSSSKKVKATSRFKCPGCGKTNTHNHYAIGYFYTHVQVIRVV